MFEKLKLRTVKAGDILFVFPSKEQVKVMYLIEGEATTIFLKDYWLTRHNIKLPETFKIVVCQFATSPYKDYNYPLLTECVRKPFRQKGLAFQWKLARQQFLMRKGKGNISMGELMGIHPEDITKARESNFWRKK